MSNPTAFFISGALNGCQWYRIRQPAYKIAQKNALPCGLSVEMKNEDIEFAIDKSDILVSQNFTDSYLDYVENERGANQKIVFDYDDNIFDLSPYNPAYQYHGTREVDVTLADGKVIKLWRDGEREFDIKRNEKAHDNFIRMLKAADLVTTPSMQLSWVLKEKGAKNVKVIKNCIDANTWYPIRMEMDDKIRIGYQGGWSHYEDFLEAGSAISAVMKTYKNTVLVVMGQHYPGAVEGLPEDRIIVEPWMSVEAYPWKFKTLGIDIAVAPLADSPFNRCKSEIKWEEYSSLEIPTVASDVGPYGIAIEDGKTGFLAKSHEDWVNCLSNLIEREEMRKEIGKAARAKVLEKYNIDDKVWDYASAYKSLFKRELIVA